MLAANAIHHQQSNLQALDMGLEPGRLVGIIGPNGAGKTSLLKILAGLARPDSGTVVLDGQPLDRLAPTQRAVRIAYLAQHGFVHWPLSVRQLVELGRYPHCQQVGAMSEADRVIVNEVMDRVGVLALADRPFNTLSGGERARALLARALAVQAEYLLVDEPIAALDLKYQLEIMELLSQQAVDDNGVCVILHDLNLAAAYCDELYLLDEGRLAVKGTPEQVLTKQNLAEIFDINASIRTTNGNVDIYPLSKK